MFSHSRNEGSMRLVGFNCQLVVRYQGNSLKLSTNYSSNICLVIDSVGNPSATATMAYACQPDRCQP